MIEPRNNIIQQFYFLAKSGLEPLLQNSRLTFAPPPNTKEQCNGVVHPVMNETITKYKKMIDEPLLRDVWMEAMCVKPGCLTQEYGDMKGTDTINFMSLDEIPNIPADQTVTYARIMVGYQEQKEDLNRIRITVGEI